VTLLNFGLAPQMSVYVYIGI